MAKIKELNVTEKQQKQEELIRGFDNVYTLITKNKKKVDSFTKSDDVRKFLTDLAGKIVHGDSTRAKQKGDLLEVFVRWLIGEKNFIEQIFKGVEVLDIEYSTVNQDWNEHWDLRVKVRNLKTGKQQIKSFSGERFIFINAKNTFSLTNKEVAGWDRIPVEVVDPITGNPVLAKDMMILGTCTRDKNLIRDRKHYGSYDWSDWGSLIEQRGYVGQFVDWVFSKKPLLDKLKQDKLDDIKDDYNTKKWRTPQVEARDFFKDKKKRKKIPKRVIIASQGVGKTLMQASEQVITFQKVDKKVPFVYLEITKQLLQQNSFEVGSVVSALSPRVKLIAICSDKGYLLTERLGLNVTQVSMNKYITEGKIFIDGKESSSDDLVSLLQSKQGTSIFCTFAQSLEFAQFLVDNNLTIRLQIDEAVEKLPKSQDEHSDNLEDSKRYEKTLKLLHDSNLVIEQTAYDANYWRGTNGSFALDHPYFGELIVHWPYCKCVEHELALPLQLAYLNCPDSHSKLKDWKDIECDSDDAESIHAIAKSLIDKYEQQGYIRDIALLKSSTGCQMAKEVLEPYFAEKGIELVVQNLTSASKIDRDYADLQRQDSNKNILVVGIYIPAKGFNWPCAEEMYIGKGFSAEKLSHVVTRVTRLYGKKKFGRVTLIKHNENCISLMQKIIEQFELMGLDDHLQTTLVERKNSKGNGGSKPIVLLESSDIEEDYKNAITKHNIRKQSELDKKAENDFREKGIDKMLAEVVW